jgi:hypothetical protein
MADPPHACIGKRCIFDNAISQTSGKKPKSLQFLNRIFARIVDSEDSEKTGKMLQGYPYPEVGQG